MSACISRDGEYSAHVPDGDWNCKRCGSLDEEGLRAELRATTADLAVAVEVARERGKATADRRAGIEALRDELTTATGWPCKSLATAAGELAHRVADALAALLPERAR